MPSLALVYDVLRWEEKAIAEAARKREQPLAMVDSRDLQFDLTAPHSMPLADVVLQRCVSYFRTLHLTAALEGQGACVVNPLQTTLVTGNKLLTTVALRRAGVPMPKTAVAFTPEGALATLNRLGYPAILKPTIGSWGRLVALLKDPESAQSIFEDREHMFPLYHVLYLQEFVKRPPRDIRSIVVGDRVVAAIYRVATTGDWRTNTARGGKAEACPITPDLEELCLRATQPFGSGIYGVDLMESPDGLLVHEVNNTTEFKNTVPATGVDIPALVVDFLLTRGR